MMVLLTKKEQERILKTIQHGDPTALKLIKAKSPHFHWTSIAYEKTGDTALHIASRLGHTTLIDYLLDEYSPCSVDVKNKDDKTPLHEAAQFAQLESVLRLCSYGCDVNALRRGDWTPLMLACTKGRAEGGLDIVRALVERGALLNLQNKDGWTCAHILARDGSSEVFDYLVSRGLKSNLRTRNGRTPLHIAALHGNKALLKPLLNHVDINCRDGCGNTPLHEAILGQHIDVAKILVGQGADGRARNNCDMSVLHLAASQDSFDVLNYIIHELKFDVNTRNKSGWTVAHCAARKGSKKVFEYVKELGADLLIQDNFGRTAMDYLRYQ